MLPAAAPAAMPGMVAGTTADTGATALAVRPVVADAVAVGVDVSRAVAAVVARATVLSLAPLRRARAARPRRAASRRERRLCRKTEPRQRERPGNRQRRPCSSQHLYHPLVSTGHPPLTTDTIQEAGFLHGTTIFFSGGAPARDVRSRRERGARSAGKSGASLRQVQPVSRSKRAGARKECGPGRTRNRHREVRGRSRQITRRAFAPEGNNEKCGRARPSDDGAGGSPSGCPGQPRRPGQRRPGSRRTR